MKKSLICRQFSGFIFVSVLGSLLHFLYDFTGKCSIVAPFSAVNESTWEHMKILFFPMLVFALIESSFLKKDYPSFWCVKLKGILLGLVLIPVLFYTYNGVFGKSPDFVNIAIFFVAAAIAFIYETKLLKKTCFCISGGFSLVILIVMAVAFGVFTFLPPHIPLFESPV